MYIGQGEPWASTLRPESEFYNKRLARQYTEYDGRWFANPEDPLAIEPSDAAKRQMDLYDQIIATASLEEQVDLFRRILDIAQEEFYVIGISLPTLSYGIVRNDFHNVPAIMPQSFQYPTPGPTTPEQYFRSGN